MKNRKKRNTALKIFSIQFGCVLFRAAFHYALLRTNNPIKLKFDEKTNYMCLSLFNCLSFYHTKSGCQQFYAENTNKCSKNFRKTYGARTRAGERAIRQAVQRRTPVPARRFRSAVLRLFFCRFVLFVLRGVCHLQIINKFYYVIYKLQWLV